MLKSEPALAIYMLRGRATLIFLIIVSLINTSEIESLSTEPQQKRIIGILSEGPDILVTIQNENGVHYEANHTISGRIISNSAISKVDWQIMDGVEIRDNGSILNTIEIIDVGSTTTYGWSVELDANLISPCSCLLVIDVENMSGRQGSGSIIIFVGNYSMLPPALILRPTDLLHLSEEPLELELVLTSPAGNGTIEWAATNGTGQDENCSDGGISSTPPVSGWTELSFTSLSKGVLNLNTTTWQDGWAVIHIRTEDIEGRTSWVACAVIAIDSSPPIVSLVGDSNLLESSETALFDGSVSVDPFWGRDGLIHIWNIEKISGSQADTKVIAGFFEDAFILSLNESGIYRINLTVSDASGRSNSTELEVIVANTKPIASFRIDGTLARGDNVLRLANSDWSLDASESTDSSNDIPNLEYLWSLDGVPLMTGKIRTLTKPSDTSTTHTLSLTVTDDDGASDTLELAFGIAGTKSDPEHQSMFTSPIYLMVSLGGILLIIGLSFAYLQRGNEEGIEKWTNKSRENDSDEDGG